MMVEYRKCCAANNNIQHGIHSKHGKQRNRGHGNDTRQNVEENILCIIYKVPPSTPYWGLLIELGIRPI